MKHQIMYDVENEPKYSLSVHLQIGIKYKYDNSIPEIGLL